MNTDQLQAEFNLHLTATKVVVQLPSGHHHPISMVTHERDIYGNPIVVIHCKRLTLVKSS